MHQPFDPADRKYRCCCGCCHVERAALVVGVLGLLGAIGTSISLVRMDSPLPTDLASTILAVVAYALLVYAQQRRRSAFYVNYLVLEGVRLTLSLLYIVALSVLLIWAPEFWQRFLLGGGGGDGGVVQVGAVAESVAKSVHHHPRSPTHSDPTKQAMDPSDAQTQMANLLTTMTRILTGIQLVACVIGELLTLWFWSVGYRAYQFVKRMEEESQQQQHQHECNVWSTVA